MLKTLRGGVIGFMVCALLFGGVAFAAELNIVPNPFPAQVNKEPYPIEAYNIDNYTYAKWADVVKAINKALGQEVIKLNFDQVNSVINLDIDPTITITKNIEGASTVSETTTTPYRNPIMVDSTTPPETIDGLSVYTVDGVQYVAARTKKDTKGNDAIGFDSKYFEDLSKFFIMYTGGKYSLRKTNPETEILSIPVEKQYVLGINSVLCVEYSYYKNTVEPLIKPVEEPAEEAE